MASNSHFGSLFGIYNMLMRVFFSLYLFSALTYSQKSPGFDPKALDRSADPCANFYRYACGGWLAANPVPSDQARWGRFDVLQDRNRTILQNILESASANKPGRTAIEQKIGDYYFSCMDEKTIDQRGTAPLKPDLDRIAAIEDKSAITGVVVQMYRTGSAPFFRFSSEQDARDSTQVIAGLDQGGLGLPDRDYYFKADEKSVEIRKKYIAHVTRMFELLGLAPDAAATGPSVCLLVQDAEERPGILFTFDRRSTVSRIRWIVYCFDAGGFPLTCRESPGTTRYINLTTSDSCTNNGRFKLVEPVHVA